MSSTRMGRNPFEKAAPKKGAKKAPRATQQPTTAEEATVVTAATVDAVPAIDATTAGAVKEAEPALITAASAPAVESAKTNTPVMETTPAQETVAAHKRTDGEPAAAKSAPFSRPRVLGPALALWQLPLAQVQRTMRWAMIDVPTESFMMGLRFQLKTHELIQNSIVNAMSMGFGRHRRPDSAETRR